MAYEIRLRKKDTKGKPGKIIGRLGQYATIKAAKPDAQALADRRTFAPGVQITIEKVPTRRKNGISRGRALAHSANIAQATGRLYNPRTRRGK